MPAMRKFTAPAPYDIMGVAGCIISRRPTCAATASAARTRDPAQTPHRHSVTMPKLTPRLFWLGYLVALLTLVGLLSVQINSDWRFLHEDNGMHYSIFAYSHLAEGPAATGFHNAYRDPASGAIVQRYLNHPPLLGLSLAGAFALVGSGDFWVARSLAIFYHMVLFLGVSWLAWRLFDRRLSAPLLTAWLFVLMPMSFYFGKIVVYPPITMCFVSLGLICHYLALTRLLGDRPAWPWLAAALPAWWLAVNAGWVAQFFLFSLGMQALYLAWRHPAQRRRLLGVFVLLGVVGVAGLAQTLTHIALVGGDGFLSGLQTGLEHKLGGRRLSREGWLYLINGPGNILDFFRRYFALGPALLSLYWAYAALRRHWRAPSQRETWLLTLLLPGLLYAVIANEGVTQHAYYLYYLLPFVVLATVDMIYRIRDWLAALPRGRRRTVWSTVAVLAIVASIAQAGDLLVARYSGDWDYTVRRVANLRSTFLVPPEQRVQPAWKVQR